MASWKSCLFWKGFLPELWITRSPEEPLVLPFELLIQMQASVSSGEPSDEAGAEIAQKSSKVLVSFLGGLRVGEHWETQKPPILQLCACTQNAGLSLYIQHTWLYVCSQQRMK